MFKLTSDYLANFRSIASILSGLKDRIDTLFNGLSRVENRLGGVSPPTYPIAITQGGTGQTSQTAAFDALAPTTTSGDIIYHDGTDNVRLAKGSDGDVLTLASGLPSWAPPSAGSGWSGIVKPADQTKVSDNAFADDTDLKFAVAANDVVSFEFNVYWYQETAAPDIKVTLNGPSSPTRIMYWVEYQQPSGGNVTSFVTATAYGTSHALITGTVATNTVGVARINGLLQNGANAGTLALQWAQNTSDVNDTTLLAGSSVRYMIT